MPDGATGIRTLAFTGAYGSNSQDADIVEVAEPDHCSHPPFAAISRRPDRVIGWDKGLVHEPTALDLFWLYLRSNWILILPVLAFGIMFWLWWTRGRDPRQQPISVQYDPPDKLTPGEVGTLVDNSAAMRDITATIVDLAVKGYFDHRADRSRINCSACCITRNTSFHMKKPATEWQDALGRTNWKCSMRFLMSGSRDTVKLSELQNHFYVHLPKIRDCIFDALVTDGYYLHRPDRVRASYLAGGVVVGVIIVALGVSYGATHGIAPLSVFVAGIASAVAVCGFGWFMPARTSSGARTLEKVLGL